MEDFWIISKKTQPNEVRTSTTRAVLHSLSKFYGLIVSNILTRCALVIRGELVVPFMGTKVSFSF